MSIQSYLNNPFSRAFFAYFPHYRGVFNEAKQLNALFSQIECIAFASFPSLRKTASNGALHTERVRVISNIQESPYADRPISAWLKSAAEKIDQMKKRFLFAHEKKQLDLLEQQHLALSYRSGALSKGYDISQGEALATQVEPIIRAYISHPKIFPGRHQTAEGKEPAPLTARERERLIHACTRYPELFRKLIERHTQNPKATDEWTANFVKWSLRSGCSIGVFVKMPIERESLSKIHLDKRSGAIDGKKGIAFNDVGVFGCFRRTLCVKMDDKMQPIQGDFKKRVVTLKNLINPLAPGLTLRIKDILDSFGKKTHSYGQVDYLAGGVRNWNSIHLGSYNGRTKKLDTVAVDSVLRELKTKVPLAKLTAVEMQERYSLPTEPGLVNGQWALALRASRLKPNLNILEAHGYSEIVYKENDRYFVFPMGVQPISLPQKDLAKLLYLTSTNKSGLHYPDESFFLKQRQQLGILFPLSREEEVRLHFAISAMHKSAQEGSLLFQFGGTNCSYHIQRLFDQVIAAPFYEKIQEIADKAFSQGNFLSETIDRMHFKKAFEGLNHDLLDKILGKLVDHLWEENNTSDLRELAQLCQQLLSKAYQREIPLDPSKISTDNPDCKQPLKAFVFETIESVRFYRMDLFRIETDQALLSSLNKVIKLVPWRWMKQIFANTVLFLLGSWRWIVVRKPSDTSNRTTARVEISAMAANPLVQEGYLNHPAALWEWMRRKDERLAKLQTILRPLQTT